jgi:hypothetical protein
MIYTGSKPKVVHRRVEQVYITNKTGDKSLGLWIDCFKFIWEMTMFYTKDYEPEKFTIELKSVEFDDEEKKKKYLDITDTLSVLFKNEIDLSVDITKIKRSSSVEKNKVDHSEDR